MDKLKMHTVNKADENFRKLAALFPNAVTETIDENGKVVRAIDKDILMQEISTTVVEGREERYQFTWPDKKKSILLANSPIAKTLRPCREESVDFDTTENLYIEGDNLDVLKLLQEMYLGKIKMIYIDPPYNTGNDFVYNDDFAESADEYLANSGQFDADGNRLVQNTESNGRFHTDWLNMIYSRMKLAKDLLSDDGVMFISIDDNEVINLKKVCDEVFGEDNFINIISAKMKNIAGASGGGEDKRLKKNIEYILIYAKDYFVFSHFNKVYIKTEISDLLDFYRKENISWKYTSVIVDYGEKQFYGKTVDGDGNDITIFKRNNPIITSVSKLMADEHLTEGEVYAKYYDRIFTTAMPQSSIRTRVYEYIEEPLFSDSLYSIEYVPKTGKNKGCLYEQFYKGEKLRLFAWFRDVAIKEKDKVYKLDAQGTFWDGINLNNLTKEGDVQFENGKKPLDLLTKIIKMMDNSDGYYLDFFSGSATTAHAVMQLNSEDGGNRKFIMVQLPEKTNEKSEAYKAGYKNICEIGKERIRRAGVKIKAENPMTTADLDTGFRVLKLDSTNMKDVYYNPDDYELSLFENLADNIKEDRTPEDLLFQVMLDLGVLLSSKIEETTICEKKVFNVADDNFLIACFDENVSEETITEIAKMKPYYFVMRDNSMSNDSVSVNFEQIFETYSPSTIRKVL